MALPVVRYESFVITSLSDEAISELVRSMALRWGAKRIEESGSTLSFRLGSRVLYRLWGAMTDLGRRNQPVIVSAFVAERNQSRTVRLVMQSDDHFYAARMQSALLAYEERWSRILAEMTAELAA